MLSIIQPVLALIALINDLPPHKYYGGKWVANHYLFASALYIFLILSGLAGSQFLYPHNLETYLPAVLLSPDILFLPKFSNLLPM